MMFNSRGLKDAAAKKGSVRTLRVAPSLACHGPMHATRRATPRSRSQELEAALMEASEGGKIPIVCDTSPCLSQIKVWGRR
jgi:D-lactate dehydrogenase